MYLTNIQKNLAKVVVFNRVFSFSVFLTLTVYLFQLNSKTNVITIGLIAISMLVMAFNLVLSEIVGQLARKRTILTSDICEWLGKVLALSSYIVVTIAALFTGNLYYASFFVIPIIMSSFLGHSRTTKLGVISVLFALALQHTGIMYWSILINNQVAYVPSSLIMASCIACVLIISSVIINEAKQTNQKANILQSMATTDKLTGLMNRRYFDRRLTEEIARARRHTSNLSLAMFDVDHFKRINDTYGHTVGDLVLAEFGALVLDNTRESDISSRYGGEEFALILPETTQMEAYDLLERVRALVESYTFVKDQTPVAATISVGIAQYDPEMTVKDFIEQADSCLYQAKQSGRNKVVFGTFTTPKLNLQKYANQVDYVKN